jgi:hypothetical protein
MRRFSRTVALAAALTMVAPTVAQADDREPAPSRQGVNRFMDSGHAVWAYTPTWIRSLALCVARHESIMAGHYNADNSRSTASGRYQMLQSTWDGNARWAKWKGRYVARAYVGTPASSVAPWIQDVVFIHSIRHGGIKAWHGTWCPGT